MHLIVLKSCGGKEAHHEEERTGDENSTGQKPRSKAVFSR